MRNSTQHKGKTFNHLRVLDVNRTSYDKNGRTQFVCECLNCGNKNFVALADNVINGRTTSCGCFPKPLRANLQGVEEMILQGKSAAKIAATLKVDNRTVQTWLKRHGWVFDRDTMKWCK